LAKQGTDLLHAGKLRTVVGYANAWNLVLRTNRGLVALLTEALDLLDEADSPMRAQVMARLGIELYWSEREQGVALCRRAVDIARRLDDQHTSIIVLWARHLSLRNPDSLEQRLADTREVITIAERAGERDFALEARFYRIADLLESGDIVGADFEQLEYLTAEAELRDRFKRGLLLESMRALMEGRLGDSETLAQQAFATGQQSGRPLALNSFLIQHGNTLWERGRLGELEAPLRAFIAQNPLIVFARCGLLLCLIQLGRHAEARIEFENRRRTTLVSCRAIGTGYPRCSCLPTSAPISVKRRGDSLPVARPLFIAQRDAGIRLFIRLDSVRARQARSAQASMMPTHTSKLRSPPIAESEPPSGWLTRSMNSRACF
jgi:hypothetical protein